MLKGSGIGTAIEHQRQALELVDIEVTRSHREKFDIIDINTIGPRAAYVAHKMRWKGVPVVMHTHTTAEDFANSFKFSNQLAPRLKGYLKYFYNQADMLISPTSYARDRVTGYGVNAKAMEVISNGVDTESFRYDLNLRESFRNMHGMQGVCVYSVGHVFKRKGVLDFLRLAREFPENEFMWIGRVYKNLVGSDIMSAVDNRPDNVRFTGYVKDVVAANCAGDIFLFPSYCENQGIAILEAACCAQAMIVRDIPAYDGWLIDGENCLMVKDEEGFKRHLERLIEDEDLRARLGKNAHKMSADHSLKIVGKQLRNAYESVLEAAL